MLKDINKIHLRLFIILTIIIKVNSEVLSDGEIKVTTLKDVVDYRVCNEENWGAALSMQLLQYFELTNCCDAVKTGNIFYTYKSIEKKKLYTLELLERNTYIEIEKTLQLSNLKLLLRYAFLNLPEYYLYTQWRIKNFQCADESTFKMLADIYDDCKLCRGTYFQAIDNAALQILRQNPAIVFDSTTQLFSIKSNQNSLHQHFLKAFQTLWNCNSDNLDDLIEVTGIYDAPTQERLGRSPINGFQYICNVCKVDKCLRCDINNLERCNLCQDGFELKNSKCVKCSINQCQKCYLDQNTTKCKLCEQGSYLIYPELNQCVQECPSSDYKQTPKACVKCELGQYAVGVGCEWCQQYCKYCKDNLTCDECFQGYSLNSEGKCIIIPDKCGKPVCDPGYYQSDKPPHDCFKCYESCETCSGPGSDQCLTCKGIFILYQNNCISKGPIDNTVCNFSCKTCEPGDKLFCTECKSDFPYSIKQVAKFLCYTQCPSGYLPDQSRRCNPKEDLPEDECGVGFFLQCQKDEKNNLLDKPQCQPCPDYCVACSSSDFCDECMQGYYLDKYTLKCLQCHSSCSKCSGPESNKCITCTNPKNLYPNEQGECSPEGTFKDEVKDDQKCSLYSLKTLNFQLDNIFTLNNERYSKEYLIDQQSCKIDTFKKIYDKDDSGTFKDCKDEDIKRGRLQDDGGEIIAIYASILSSLKVSIQSVRDKSNKIAINPITLKDFAIKNSLMQNLYINKFDLEDSVCKNLICTGKFPENISGMPENDSGDSQQLLDINGNEVWVKEILNIDLGTQCNLEDEQILAQQKELNRGQQALNFLDINKNNYLVLTVCGIDSQSKKKVYKKAIVKKYLGNNFVHALFVNDSNTEPKLLYLSGATEAQNEQHKNGCKPNGNSFTKYIITRFSLLEAEVQKQSSQMGDNLRDQFNQVSQKNVENRQLCENNKTFECLPLEQYILSLDNQLEVINQFYKKKYTFLTKTINMYEIKHLFFKDNISFEDLQKCGASISKVQAQKYFSTYVSDLLINMFKVYDLQEKDISSCLVNVLVGIAATNGGNFIIQLKDPIKKKEYSKMLDIIDRHGWCQGKQDKCERIKQTLKGVQ